MEQPQKIGGTVRVSSLGSSAWKVRLGTSLLGLVSAAWGSSATVFGQSFGPELHNTLMPASGGMGGVSIARPQDLTSSLNANPASLTQFRGTQFTFAGGWAEATFNMTQASNIPVVGQNPLVEPYSAKSTAPGVPAGNIGLTQDLDELGLPATVGVGFVTSAGAFADYRHVPQSGGTNAGLAIFSMPVGVGVDVTDRLTLGSSLALGIAFLDGPFVEAGGMTPDCALRGTVGANYLLTDVTTVGGYYQTAQSYTFDNAFILNPGVGQTTLDVSMDLPQNVGVGFANRALMDGNLLIGIDLVYKLWDEADLFNNIYDNQWAVQTGVQLTRNRLRYRAGYVWAENPMDPTPGNNLGGVVQPGDLPAVRYSQGLLAVTSQHRISFGVGMVDFLPGIDMDVMAGGMFRDSEQLGNFTTTSIESYWIGAGLTWRFGRGGYGSCLDQSTPDHWIAGS
ncbi:OmpP1/FadL family transporter [Pirellulaceae bacterium SH501]